MHITIIVQLSPPQEAPNHTVGTRFKVHRFFAEPLRTLASGFGVSGGAFDVKVLRIR